MRKKWFFLTFFSEFFSNFEQKFFRLLAKKLQEVDKTTLCVFRRTIFGLKFFSKVLSRFGFSSENLAWFSNFYLRVQRKNSGRNIFFILLFRFFSEFERNFFSDFWPKNFKKLSKLTSVCADEQFLAWNFFQKFWTVLDFLQKPLAWCSNFYLRVHSKNSGRNDFFNFLFIIFSDFERIFFRLSAKKLQVFKLTFYVSRGTRCGLNFFKKNWIVLDFLEKPLAWFSKFYLRVQSEICGSNNLFICSFQNFFKFSAKYFQTFGQKTSRSCQNYLPRVQMNKFWLEKFFKNFQPFWIFWRTWAWFSNFIFVSRVKNPEETVFLFYFSEFFRILSEKIFRLLARKLQEIAKIYPLREQTNNFWL